MEIKSMRAIEGKNMYCLHPVIVLQLDLGKYSDCYTNELQQFTEGLLKIVPTLREHYCSRGRPGGFVERLREGTLLGHVVEHVALELQYLVGSKVVYGQTRLLKEPGLYQIVLEYEVKEVGFLAIKLALGIVDAVLNGRTWKLEDGLNKLNKVKAKFSLGPSTQAIVDACRERNIPVLPLGEGSLLQLGYGSKQRRIEATITQNTSCIAVDIAGDKLLTKNLLAEAGIPVPKGNIAKSLDQALLQAKKIGKRVTVKPYNGNQGKGVSLNLQSPQEITSAFQIAKNYSEKILIEEYIEGKNYRVLVVGNKIVAAAERIPTFVVGDGKNSIRKLIEIINEDPRRGFGHEKPLTKIKIDPELILVLTKRGLTLDYIPSPGERINLRENCNISSGGIAVDVTEEVHPENAELILRAVSTIGLDVAGVDLVTLDIRQPMEQQGGAIIEINAAPGIRMHLFPSQGTARDAGKAIVDSMFGPEEDGRIPVVAVTGTNGKTTTTRLIANMLKTHGHLVGYTTSTGIYIDEKCILKGDNTGPLSAKTVLRDSRVTAAVLETARGGMLRNGLGYDLAQVAVVTNITEDHLGQYNINTLEDLAMLKSLVVEALPPTGYAILNADDPLVAAMARRTKAQVIYFSRHPQNIIVRRHLGIGGKGVFVSEGQVCIAQGRDFQKILPIKEIALTFNGQASYNTENALAATGAAWALNIEVEEMAKSLRNFGLERWHNPGRLEFYEIKGVKIIVDYGHNPAGLEEVFKFVQSLQGNCIRGVIGIPGDRLDTTIRKAGQVAARCCQWIYIKEDRDLRGRKPGEVAQLLFKGAMSGGNGKHVQGINIELNEVAAFECALKDSVPGDIVVVFYEELEPILQSIARWAGDSLAKTSSRAASAN
ncbi:cyanophycin synthetase [Bacillota bacterium LX-D]|nr:cyanophycin synthetase [Bacillota bacterium LX-D]